MKSKSYSSIFSPLYVFLSGSLGILIALFMFTWNYPVSGDGVGEAFVSTQPFYIWVFLVATLCSFLTIFILPLWGIFIMVLKDLISAEDEDRKQKIIILVILEAILLTIAIFALLQFISTIPLIDLRAYVPLGHSGRMLVMYIYTFITALPVLLGMFLIHTAAGKLSAKIDEAKKSEAQLFPLIGELLSFRTLHQNYLMILGIILSLIPVTTSGLRAILIALNPENEQNFPITNAILFGLVFTILLLFIYVPTHLALTETSRKLRDLLCPLAELETLTTDMNQRKALDELLQTNIGFTQNLKAGLITLAPLVTSLLTSLLNVNIPL